MRPTCGARPRVGPAIISGGSSGIGLALAHGLARDGWDLTLLARNLERLGAAKDALMAHGVAVGTRSVDVADAVGVERAVAAAVARGGRRRSWWPAPGSWSRGGSKPSRSMRSTGPWRSTISARCT
jgi:NAD(P)-dependent dehydrogenase (short-subunit alcohol dehydrogenase family)